MRDLKGKVAVVTGAARGIGLAFAQAAAAEGMTLVLTDVDADELAAAVAGLTETGVIATGLPLDVGDLAAMGRLADHCYERFGAVHVIVSNAGIADLRPVWEVTPEDWNRVMNVNLGGTLNAIWSFLPRMLAAREPGHLIAVSSSAAFRSRTGVASYNASKAALLAVCETLAQELISITAPIGVSVVMPGSTQSRLSRVREGADHGDSGAPSLAPGMRTAEDVAAQMIDAIRSGRFYVFTHPETYPDYERKFTAVLNAIKGGRPAPVVIDPWPGGPESQPTFSFPSR